MKKIVRTIFAFTISIIFISLCKAEEIDFIETKYYKTVDYIICNDQQKVVIKSNTYEISKEEFELVEQVDNVECKLRNSATIETTYKKMTTTISQNGIYYRYKNVLIWKNIPSTRSYDIMGIGHYSSVKIHGSINFIQTYKKSGTTYTTYSSYEKIGNNGIGVVFKIPTGTLSSLKQELYFDVEKNVNATIVKQIAAGDYSHATSSITLNNAKNFSVNTNGIILENSIYSYYDDINTATAIWTGTW